MAGNGKSSMARCYANIIKRLKRQGGQPWDGELNITAKLKMPLKKLRRTG
jgi:hypothetical protein